MRQNWRESQTCSWYSLFRVSMSSTFCLSPSRYMSCSRFSSCSVLKCSSVRPAAVSSAPTSPAIRTRRASDEMTRASSALYSSRSLSRLWWVFRSASRSRSNSWFAFAFLASSFFRRLVASSSSLVASLRESSSS